MLKPLKMFLMFTGTESHGFARMSFRGEMFRYWSIYFFAVFNTSQMFIDPISNVVLGSTTKTTPSFDNLT